MDPSVPGAGLWHGRLSVTFRAKNGVDYAQQSVAGKPLIAHAPRPARHCRISGCPVAGSALLPAGEDGRTHCHAHGKSAPTWAPAAVEKATTTNCGCHGEAIAANRCARPAKTR